MVPQSIEQRDAGFEIQFVRLTVNLQSNGDRSRPGDSLRPRWRGGRLRFRNQQAAGYGDAGPFQEVAPGQAFFPWRGLFWLLLFPFHALLLRLLNAMRHANMNRTACELISR